MPTLTQKSHFIRNRWQKSIIVHNTLAFPVNDYPSNELTHTYEYHKTDPVYISSITTESFLSTNSSYRNILSQTQFIRYRIA